MLNKSRLINLIGTIIIGVVFLAALLVVLIAGGTFSATKTKLVISSESVTAPYTGEVIRGTEWELLEGSVNDGHTLTVSVGGSQLGVGTSENHILAHVFDSNGVEVTEDYEIEYFPGTLEVLPQELTIIAGSAQKVYDGLPLTPSEYSVMSMTSLADGEYLDVTLGGSITEVGETASYVEEVIITDSEGKDTTKNYSIFTQTGLLTVVESSGIGNTLVFASSSGAFYYTGLPQTAPTYGLVAGTLKEGHYADVWVSGEQTDVGNTLNALTVQILDEAGVDVTGEYSIVCVPGTLTVLKQPMAVISENGELSWQTADEKSLFEGLRVLPITDPADNSVTGVTILDWQGNDITENFSVMLLEGSMFGDGSQSSGGGNGALDMNANISGSGGDSTEPALVYLLESDYTGDVYLRAKSFGDYNGASNQAFLDAEPYTKLIDGELPANYLTMLALMNSRADKGYLKIMPTDVRNFVLAYYPTQEYSYAFPMNDVSLLGMVEEAYEQTFYIGENYANVQLPSAYTAYEAEYSDFVYDQYLQIDSVTLAFLQEVIDAEGFDPNDPQIIEKVASFVQNEYSYNLDYDSAMDQHPNQVIAFMSEYKEGICGHFSSAATMLYRALGIPARFTIGYKGETKVGEITEVTTNEAHAWVEVYLDGIGWVMVEVTGGDGSGGNEGGGNEGGGNEGGENEGGGNEGGGNEG
ncbi:MAG: transglutaminase domain-containing protein, partial [Ruminococcaceae bacterium]|nr:transglutaminase domain-containing protein [Oscillospiraceae bacterium]